MNIKKAKFDNINDLISLWHGCGLSRPWNDPTSDIMLAFNAKECEIFIGEINSNIMASAMCGFDGHRGWIYYVAVDEKHRKLGYSKQMVAAAEQYLKSHGYPKIQLMIRNDNINVQDIYAKLVYKKEDCVLMSKWLKPPSAEHKYNADTNLNVVITYLKLTNRHMDNEFELPAGMNNAILTHVSNMDVGFFRYLYNNVGEKYLWWEKRIISDQELFKYINRNGMEFHILNIGGMPAGFIELYFDPVIKDTAEISCFGLLPNFIGKKIGSYLLNKAINICWEHNNKPQKILLETCTLDHPMALLNYQKSGFKIFDKKSITIKDPRSRGIIPRDIILAQPEANIE